MGVKQRAKMRVVYLGHTRLPQQPWEHPGKLSAYLGSWYPDKGPSTRSLSPTLHSPHQPPTLFSLRSQEHTLWGGQSVLPGTGRMVSTWAAISRNNPPCGTRPASPQPPGPDNPASARGQRPPHTLPVVPLPHDWFLTQTEGPF